MHKRAIIYAWFIVAAGAATLAAAGIQWRSQQLDQFLACLLLAILASTFKVRLPASTSAISPNIVPILLAIGTLSWQETVVIAACSGIVQSAWRPAKRPMVLQILFNGANLTLAAGVADAVSHFAAGQSLIGMLLAAAVVYQFVNVLIVSTVLCLLEDGSLVGIWRSTHFWSFPYHLVGAGLAAVWAQYAGSTAAGPLCLLGAGTLYLMSAFYGELVKRLGAPSPVSH